jgi:hypothetical protein
MAAPPIQQNISEQSSVLKPRYRKSLDPNSFKARKGFRHQVSIRSTPPRMRHPKRGA